jgi:anti-sigma factor RsiW
MAHPAPTRLAAYAAGRLGAAEAAEVERHLIACSVCREEVLAALPLVGPGVATLPTVAPAAFPPATVAGPGPRGATLPASVGPGQGVPTPAQLPAQFGRYRILRRLGRGGMGSVYLAHDTQLDRRVALKVPHIDADGGPHALERFYREARAAATLSHPHLCPVHDVGEIDGVPYLTMAYVEGRPLTDFIDPKKPLPPRQATVLVRKLALALHEAHARGVIHRDLKPANVLITAAREPMVLDFGLARLSRQSDMRLTLTGRMMGTPAYMSPEQVVGDVDAMGPGCDIYSLGVMLYELLTGRVPFEGTGMGVLALILTAQPPPPSSLRPSLDGRLEAICLQAMAKRPADRHASMEELAAALQDYLRGSRTATPSPAAGQGIPQAGEEDLAGLGAADLPADPTTRTARARTRARRRIRRLWTWLAVLVAVTGLVAGAALLVQKAEGVIAINLHPPEQGMRIRTERVRLNGELKKVADLDKALHLPSGEYSLEIEGKNFDLERPGSPAAKTIRFTVRPGENDPLPVHFKLAPGAEISLLRDVLKRGHVQAQTAAKYLAERGNEAVEAVDDLVDILNTASDSELRWKVAFALGSIGLGAWGDKQGAPKNVVTALREAAKSKDDKVSRSAGSALRILGYPVK